MHVPVRARQRASGTTRLVKSGPVPLIEEARSEFIARNIPDMRKGKAKTK
jgi:hypothetical protein